MSTLRSQLKAIGEFEWEISKSHEMLVPARVFGSRGLVERIDEQALNQIVNVACLPGIQEASIAMPDAHWGYGFPIGGVAAMDREEGVVSIGGVGFDCGCGVRLLSTDLSLSDIRPKIKDVMRALFASVPAGLGRRGEIVLARSEVDDLLAVGAKFTLDRGYGTARDLERTEDAGSVEGGNPSNVSDHAKLRERGQVGTIGSGNHYLEVQYVDEIIDEHTAHEFGIEHGQVMVSIHCGSRGLGHQVGTDYLPVLEQATRKYGIPMKEKELACAPISSEEGQRYLSAEVCAINYSYANRQVIAHLVRSTLSGLFPGIEVKTVWDHVHNSARFERHEIRKGVRDLLIHRKGATRAFGRDRDELPPECRNVGQPVIVGGTMGTQSFVLCGTGHAMKASFGSACHGAGRSMSRTQARRRWFGRRLAEELEREGILVMCHSWQGLAEEAPGAYKDITEIVDSVHNAGLARKVARLRPLGVVKG